MIWTYRAVALMTFVALVGCNPIRPSETPTSHPPPLHLYSSPETTTMVSAMSWNYREYYPETQLMLETREMTLPLTLPETDSHFFITHHLPAGSAVWALPLAQDGLVFITHPDNPVNNLTPDDIRRLYQGILDNWQEVGGENLAVILFTREEESSLRAEFNRLIMGQRRISPNARIIPSSTAAIESVMTLPGALAYISFSQIQETVKSLAINTLLPTHQTIADQLYPLRMTVFMVGQQEPTNAPDFIHWVQSPDGQAIIGDYYIPQIR